MPLSIGLSPNKDMPTAEQSQRFPHQTRDSVLQVLRQREEASKAVDFRQQQYLTLPSIYLPCIRPARDLEADALTQLVVAARNHGKAVTVTRRGRSFPQPTKTLLAVEDIDGNAAILELYCIDADFETALTYDGARITIKEPLVTDDEHGGWCIRVDHPTDLVSTGVPGSGKDASQWKGHGNALFKNRQYGEAAAAYQAGLNVVPDGQDSLARDLHRNLAQTWLSLGFFDNAREHAHHALSVRSGAASLFLGTAGMENRPAGIKAFFRAARAAYCLEDFGTAKNELQELLKLDPKDESGRKEILKTYKRLNEEQNGSYDFGQMLQDAVAKGPHIDAASFVKCTKVLASEGKGNGLFAAKDFGIGDLVLCEKAFAATFALAPKYEQVRTYDTARKLYSAIPVSLWTMTAQRLIKNPSLASRVLGLSGYQPGLGHQDIRADRGRAFDVFQIHDIVARNSFGIPLPNGKALTKQWGLYSVQSASDGSTYLKPRNSAIFCHASFINHSCFPNVEKRFIGDVIMIRATRPIQAGEEILLDYAPGEFADARTRKQGFERTWQFSCSCELCIAESELEDAALDHRALLAEQVNELSERLSRSMPDSVHWDASISRLEGLAKELKSRYRSSELPRTLSYTHTSLSLLYGVRKDVASHLRWMKEGFESLGWQSPLEAGGKLLPASQSQVVLDMNVPQLLSMACSVGCARGDAVAVEEMRKAQRRVYLALNGTMCGFEEAM